MLVKEPNIIKNKTKQICRRNLCWEIPVVVVVVVVVVVAVVVAVVVVVTGPFSHLGGIYPDRHLQLPVSLTHENDSDPGN